MSEDAHITGEEESNKTSEVTTTTVNAGYDNVPVEIPAIKTGHAWLREMVLVRNYESSYEPKPYPVTNRVCFIINALNEIGVQYSLDIFNENGNSIGSGEYDCAKLVNIMVKFESTSGKPAVAFCAHHDVANPRSENCQDNSASVCNLLHLATKIKEKGKDLTRPVIIVFSDREEFGGIGADKMSRRINAGDFGNVAYVINLELTGLGSDIWIDTKNSSSTEFNTSSLRQKLNEVLGENTYHKVSTPFSDAVIFRAHGIDCSCIGILPKEQLEPGGTKETWHLCHSEEDTIDKTDEIDMALFVDKLLLFAA